MEILYYNLFFVYNFPTVVITIVSQLIPIYSVISIFFCSVVKIQEFNVFYISNTIL